VLLVGGPLSGARCHGFVADKGGSREKRATIFVTIGGGGGGFVEVGKWLVMVVLKL